MAKRNVDEDDPLDRVTRRVVARTTVRIAGNNLCQATGVNFGPVAAARFGVSGSTRSSRPKACA